MPEIEFNEDISQESTRPLPFKEQLSVNNKKSSYYVENYTQIEKDVLNKIDTKDSNKEIKSKTLHCPITSKLNALTFKMIEEIEKNNGQRNLELEKQILDLLAETQILEVLDLQFINLSTFNDAYKKIHKLNEEKNLDKKENMEPQNQIEELALRRKDLEKLAEYAPATSLATEKIFKLVNEMEKNNGLRNSESEIKMLSSLDFLRENEKLFEEKARLDRDLLEQWIVFHYDRKTAHEIESRGYTNEDFNNTSSVTLNKAYKYYVNSKLPYNDRLRIARREALGQFRKSKPSEKRSENAKNDRDDDEIR